jgi:hypothetical protein
MNDFVVMDVNTILELRLLRDLFNKVDQNAKSWGKGLYPSDVITCYDQLVKHYKLTNEE